MEKLYPFDSDLKRDLGAAPAPVAATLERIEHDLTVILDPGDDAWLSLDIDVKIDCLHVLNRYRWLDRLLQAYIRHARQHEPERLQNLGLAVLDYAEAGYGLRLPASPLMGPITSPGYPASLARLYEDNQLDCQQLDWLALESKRLRRALDHWLAVHVGYTPDGPT